MSVRRLVLALGLLLVAMLVMSTTASAQSLFVLNGTAREDVDPENGQAPPNEVVSINNSSSFGSITRNFGPNTSLKVKDFDNALQVKYYFQSGKMCGGGSPRFQLRIDVDGNGSQPPRNAFGPLGDSPFAALCPTLPAEHWRFEDMTNGTAKWDVSQIANGTGVPTTGNNQIQTWDQMETYFQTNFPGHGVISASVVEDPPFAPGIPPSGCTWYDNLVVLRNSMNNRDDTAGATGTCTPTGGIPGL